MQAALTDSLRRGPAARDAQSAHGAIPARPKKLRSGHTGWRSCGQTDWSTSSAPFITLPLSLIMSDLLNDAPV